MMRLRFLPVYLVVFTLYSPGEGNWLMDYISLRSCRRLLLNGQTPKGLDTLQSGTEHHCRCWRAKCVYVAFNKERQSPVYWAYTMQDDPGGNLSHQDLAEKIRSVHMSTSAVVSLLHKGRKRFVSTDITQPVTYVVSGVAPSEQGLMVSNKEGVIREHFNMPATTWLAYHHVNTAGHFSQGAMVQEVNANEGFVWTTIFNLENMLIERYRTTAPVLIFPCCHKPRTKHCLKERAHTGTHLDMEVSVQMEFAGPQLSDQGLVRQVDTFQVKTDKSDNLSKRIPDISFFIKTNVTNMFKDVPKLGGGRNAKLLTGPKDTESSLSESHVWRTYGFKAESSGSGNGGDLDKTFIGVFRERMDFLSRPQNEIKYPMRKIRQNGNKALHDSTPPIERLGEEKTTSTVRLEKERSTPVVTLETDNTTPTLRLEAEIPTSTVKLGEVSPTPTVSQEEEITAKTVRREAEIPTTTARSREEFPTPTVRQEEQITATVRLEKEKASPTVRLVKDVTTRTMIEGKITTPTLRFEEEVTTQTVGLQEEQPTPTVRLDEEGTTPNVTLEERTNSRPSLEEYTTQTLEAGFPLTVKLEEGTAATGSLAEVMTSIVNLVDKTTPTVRLEAECTSTVRIEDGTFTTADAETLSESTVFTQENGCLEEALSTTTIPDTGKPDEEMAKTSTKTTVEGTRTGSEEGLSTTSTTITETECTAYTERSEIHSTTVTPPPLQTTSSKAEVTGSVLQLCNGLIHHTSYGMIRCIERIAFRKREGFQ